MPNSNKNKYSIRPVGNAWTVVGADAATESRQRRATRIPAREMDESDLPPFLATADFEVLDRADLKSSPGRRSSDIDGSSLQLETELPDNTLAFVVARQASQAISFHFPKRTAGRRSAGAANRTTFVFDVKVSSANIAKERRGWISKAVRVILVKVANAVGGNLLSHAAKWAIPLLARQLEEHLWTSRRQGWVRITQDGMVAENDRLSNAMPTFTEGKRGLLMLHGTFSTTHAAFRSLSRTPFFAEARKLYGDNIFGFNHFTFSKTPEENVKELLDSLSDKQFAFDVITHSRGGLVARELIERSGLKHWNRKRLQIGKVILVASPNIGTPLGSASHWEETLSMIANLLELLPLDANPFTTGAAWIAESLKWIAANVLGNCPGLVAMDPNSEYIDELQNDDDIQDRPKYHAVVSNYHPPREWWARLADVGVDSFFGGANDLVVPTEGGWKTSDSQEYWVDSERIACLGLGGNLQQDRQSPIHHGNFFEDDDVARFLLSSLRDEATKLTAVDTARTLPSRAFRRRGKTQLPIGETAVDDIRQVQGKTMNKMVEVDSSIVATMGFDEEAELWLTVVSNELHSKVEDQQAAGAIPLLVAQYGSARVAVPFYTSGTNDNAGKRWRSLIGMHRQIVSYVNGGSFSLSGNADDGFPDSVFLEKFGDELFRTLFPGEVRNLYNIARFLHKKRRLKIIFSSMIPWVADMPWELAFDSSAGSFLACGDVRFVRNVLTPTPSNRITEKTSSLRILVVSAQPLGTGQLSIEDEERGIRESFGRLVDAGLVEVDVLAGASPSLLQRRLHLQQDGDGFDVLHFIGHGEFDEVTKTGYLVFEDDAGRLKRVSAASFLNILRGRDIRVVFLNACETGRGRQADYNRGVAMALVQDGIPAVVANQYSVIDRSASIFSLEFYECLARGARIGDAMREARIKLQYDGVEPMDWAVPVLFASNPDARLCKAKPRRPNDLKESDSATNASARSARRSRLGVNELPKSVAVWDAENALIYRENLSQTIDDLNAAQRSFVFQLERFTAPRGLWGVSSDSNTKGTAYLRGDKVMNRMNRIRQSIGVDYLFCVTELPLRDRKVVDLYYYLDGPISILSTWALRPPLEGMKLKKAIANHVAMSLLEDLCGGLTGGTSDRNRNHPIHTIGYWNSKRDVAHIAGQMKMSKAIDRQIREAIREKRLTAQQLESITSLLQLYQNGNA